MQGQKKELSSSFRLRLLYFTRDILISPVLYSTDTLTIRDDSSFSEVEQLVIDCVITQQKKLDMIVPTLSLGRLLYTEEFKPARNKNRFFGRPCLAHASSTICTTAILLLVLGTSIRATHVDYTPKFRGGI
jgi:hypothetical protein